MASLKIFFITSLITFNFFFNAINSQDFISFKTESAGHIKGKIQTVDGKSFSTFLGIPFAKPPVGDLRFKEPEPLDAKDAATVVDASNGFNKMCVQAFGYEDTTQSEDCLYLNVLSPKVKISDDEKYPVMVWVHGGGFFLGSASDYPVEGTLKNIVSRGVVYVSINYRLGIFGFLTTKSLAASGNYGLFDQVEALRWVQKNIQYFGGDPAQVTIFGESAGGASVSLLSISPLTDGLINQAIIMSGSALAPWVLAYDADPNDVSGNVLESLGCRRHSVKKAAKATCPYRSIAPIVDVEPNVLTEHEEEMACMLSKSVDEVASQVSSSMGMRPRIDGKFLPEMPELLIKKRNPYNLIIGITQDEIASLQFFGLPGFTSGMSQTEAEFNNGSALIECKFYKFPELVNRTVNHHYVHSSTPKESGLDEKHHWFKQNVKRDSALMFIIPAYNDALEATKTNSRVYLYSYDFQDGSDYYHQKLDFYWKGAAHGAELFSLFDSEFLGMFQQNGPHTKRDKSHDKRSAEVFGKLLTNFAKSGNPTPDESVDGVIWKPFSDKDDNYLKIDMPKIRMEKNFYEDDVDLWTRFLPALEESVDCDNHDSS